MKKRGTAVILLLLIALTLSACTAKTAASDEDGKQLRYTENELQVHSLEGEQGVYVINEDGTYSPLINAFTGYSRLSKREGSAPSRYLWFTENSADITSLIPHVSSSSKLVLLYNTTDAIPEEFVLEKYEYKGYTIGAHVYKTSSNKMYLETRGSLTNTHINNLLSEIDDENEYEVSVFNDSTQLPIANIDNNMQMLLGLDAGGYYKLEIYKGTKYLTLTTVADTQVLQSVQAITLNNPYSRTKDGYFTVNLPDNLTSGFYYFAGLGMFYYEGE